jgi:hypothetical protein
MEIIAYANVVPINHRRDRKLAGPGFLMIF